MASSKKSQGYTAKKITPSYKEVRDKILVKEQSKLSSTQIQAYTGNPTQPHMYNTSMAPNNAVRNVVLTASIYTNKYSVSLFETAAYTVFNDAVVGIVDYTGGVVGGGGNYTTSTGSNWYRLLYSTSDLPPTGYRDYRVTFASGHQEVLSILVPFGGGNPFPSGANNYGYGGWSGSCESTTFYDWSAQNLAAYGSWGSPVNYTTHRTAFSRGVYNPIGSFPDYGYTDVTTSNEIAFSQSDMAEYVANKATSDLPGTFDYKPIGGIGLGASSKQISETIVAISIGSPDSDFNAIQSELDSSSFVLNWSNVLSIFQLPGKDFSSAVSYSENIPACGVTTHTINACNDPNNMSYWGYDNDSDGILEDCAGVEIPLAVQTDPSIALWVPSPIDCCTDCVNEQGDGITFSMQPLTLNVEGTNPTTVGGTDGYIDVTITDGGFDASGIPQGLPTGVPNYTYVIQNNNAADTMCGNTAGLGVGSGTVASTSFTFGNSVLPNPNGGLLQNSGSVASATISAAGSGYTGATGVATTGGTGTGLTVNTTVSTGAVTAVVVNAAGSGYLVGDVITITGGGANATIIVGSASATYASSVAQGYVPGGTSTSAPYGLGTTNSEGFRAGVYTVYVYDNNKCLGQTAVELIEPAATIGCLDSNSLNYDSTADVADNTLCHYCRASDGELVDGYSAIIDPITSSGASFTITAPTNTTTVNSQISVSGISPSASFQSYINNVVIGSTTTQNADYIIELYKWDNQIPTGNSNFGTLSGFNADTTIVGQAINNQGNGWNIDLNAGTLTAGFTYGYYSIKIYISDPDAVVEIEQCYEIIDVVVPVGACLDTGVAVALDLVVVSDPNLYFVEPVICNVVNNFCCDTPIFEATPSSTPCNPTYHSTFSCDPVAGNIIYKLEYYDAGSWVIVTPNFTLASPASPYTTPVILNNTIAIGFGSGDYRVSITSTYPNAPNCSLYSNIINFTPTVTGCMDPAALDYDATANCSGTCTYCNNGCTDPPALNYNASATCDDGSCIYPIYGCTDSTAANWDPAATTDDGSCWYYPCGCTDTGAYNYGKDCSGAVIAYPPLCDDGCCEYCDPVPLTYTYTVTPATIITGCIANDDGIINLEIFAGGASPACTTYTLVSVLDPSGVAYIASPTLYTYGDDIVIDNLFGSITYTFSFQDCNGCPMDLLITVPLDSANCGCTDPVADNYDPSATVDDGSCLYCGCMDVNAINYNPNAGYSCTPINCRYEPSPPPCIPSNLPQILNRMQVCISENGKKYHNKLVTGMSDDCSIMNVWKLILMNYLLQRIGLECIYNCSDGNTPDAADVFSNCDALWIQGGPSTGLNDPDVSTLVPFVGTTPTLVDFSTSGTRNISTGDVIKHPISGNIWIFIGIKGTFITVDMGGIDPETISGFMTGYWKYCNDAMKYTSNANNINYLDNFINFANTFCRDCMKDFKEVG